MNRAESYARLKAQRPDIEAAEKQIAPYEAIADLILDARIRAGLSQAELAKRAATTQARISEIESGEANTKLQTLLRIREALGTHIDHTTLLQALTNLPGSAFVAPGFITVKDMAFSGGVTIVGGGAFDYSLLSANSFVFAGTVNSAEDKPEGDDEPKTPSKAPTAANSELALAA